MMRINITKEIDEALLKGEFDFVVHSAKDLPDELAYGICVAAITESIDKHDVLVSKHSFTLDMLPFKAKVLAVPPEMTVAT